MEKQIQIPIKKEIIRELKAGDYVYLNRCNLYSTRCSTQKNK